MAVKSTDETGFCPACDDHSVGAYCDSCDESTDCGVCGCGTCGETAAGNNSDNQAAARAVSKTIQTPQDRARDTSRQFQGGSVMRWNSDSTNLGDTYSLPLSEDMSTKEVGQHIARIASASDHKPHYVRNVSPSDASKNCYMCGDDDNTDVCNNCAGDIQEQQREPW